jgi:hypothetical protein
MVSLKKAKRKFYDTHTHYVFKNQPNPHVFMLSSNLRLVKSMFESAKSTVSDIER